jgi:co-chaperonin GroES (HSP10)
MKAVNEYVIVKDIKEEKKKIGGLILTEQTGDTNRYKKAIVISVGDLVKAVKKDNSIYYDSVAGHDIFYNEHTYKVIRARDIVIVE